MAVALQIDAEFWPCLDRRPSLFRNGCDFFPEITD